jgi:hypothetical protein
MDNTFPRIVAISDISDPTRTLAYWQHKPINAKEIPDAFINRQDTGNLLGDVYRLSLAQAQALGNPEGATVEDLIDSRVIYQVRTRGGEYYFRATEEYRRRGVTDCALSGDGYYRLYIPYQN